jgi:hypothetical protein
MIRDGGGTAPPKSTRRRALDVLAGCGTDGCTEAILRAHGFTVEQMAETPAPSWQQQQSSRRDGTAHDRSRAAKDHEGRATALADRR